MVPVPDAVLQKSLSGSFTEAVVVCLVLRFLKGLQGGRTDSCPKSAVVVGKPLPLTFTTESRSFLASGAMALCFSGFRRYPGHFGVFQSFPACWFPPKRCLPPPDPHGYKGSTTNMSGV